ncbi:MAG: lipopolysaccharide kinase InaA family protein [Candidatus Micrarchaeia archaeon]
MSINFKNNTRSKKFDECIVLPDKRILKLKKGAGWKEYYLNIFIIPILNNRIPMYMEPVKSSQSILGWKANTDSGPIFIKFFKSRGIKDNLPLKKNRAFRELEGGNILLQNNFLTPSVIAYGLVSKGIRIFENFLITKWIENSLDIYLYIKKYLEPPISGERLMKKRNFIKYLGHLIGLMHKKGIYHGDLRPGNILIENTNQDFRFYFIDNEKTKIFPKGIPYRLREKNLIQLNMIVKPEITYTDRLRFFKAYMCENPEIKAGAIKIMLNVIKKTKKRLSKIYSDISKQ